MRRWEVIPNWEVIPKPEVMLISEKTTVKKSFEIETSAAVMERIERFLAFLHHNSSTGHSGLFAMSLDVDGEEKVTVSPKPGFVHEVGLCGGVGGDIEIAVNNGYTVKRMAEMGAHWQVKAAAAVYRDGELHSAAPSKLYEEEKRVSAKEGPAQKEQEMADD